MVGFLTLNYEKSIEKHINKTIIQYQTHQVVSDKNNSTKKNNKLRQMKTPDPKLPSNQAETLSQGQKINLENMKRIISSEKTILPSLKNIEWKTLMIETDKINIILPYLPTNYITELNELIYAAAKLVCEKIGISSKKARKTVKTGMGNSTGNAN